MTGQARVEKDAGVEQDRANAEFFASERREESGISDSTFTYTDNDITPTDFGADRFLRKDGDIMRGGIESKSYTITLVSDVAGASGELLNTNRLIIRGESSSDDDMLTLVLPKFETDTFIYMSNKSGEEDITILNDNANPTGNFRLVGNSDLVMTNGAIHVFLYDSVDEIYREISVRVTGTGTEVFTWTADHSANGNDLNSLKSIVFSLGGASMVSSSTGLNTNVGTGLVQDFDINSSTVLSVAAGAVSMVGNLAIVSGGIAASDFIITSGNISMGATLTFTGGGTIVGSVTGFNSNVLIGDTHDFDVNSSTVLSIASGAVSMVGSLAIVSGGVSASDFITTSGDIITSAGDITISSGSLKLVSGTPLTGSDVGWTGFTGDIFGNIQTNDSYFFRENGSTIVEMDNDGIDVRTGWYEMTEISNPGALSNHVRLFGRDNGSGKTQFMAQVGATLFVIATEL